MRKGDCVWLDFEARWAVTGSCCTVGKFVMACMLQIPLVAEFGTDHIEKATIITMQNKK